MVLVGAGVAVRAGDLIQWDVQTRARLRITLVLGAVKTVITWPSASRRTVTQRVTGGVDNTGILMLARQTDQGGVKTPKSVVTGVIGARILVITNQNRPNTKALFTMVLSGTHVLVITRAGKQLRRTLARLAVT